MAKKLKTNLSNNVYQSQFLPLIQKAETEIKKLVLYYALHLKSKTELRIKIKGIIKGVDSKLPISLYDRKSYLMGLLQTSEKMIKDTYDKVILSYTIIAALLVRKKLMKPKTPIEMVKYLKSINNTLTGNDVSKELKKAKYHIITEGKGTPNVFDYEKALKKRINELSNTITVSEVSDKKPISVWQKAELDIRHENQVAMINHLKEEGVKYAWTSTHPDCSKRCEKWQGKLFDLTAKKSELSNFRMKHKVDGHTVYCFKEVVNQVDKYGYKNNIIVGFNCRHKLREYTPNSVAPKEYEHEDIVEQRKINAKLRAYEREIRLLKQKALLYNEIDKKLAQRYKLMAKKLIAEYKEFARVHGYAWHEYRIDI